MKDGLYRVATRYLCAGFVIKQGRVVACAPILRRKLPYWKTVAVWVCGISLTVLLLGCAVQDRAIDPCQQVAERYGVSDCR